MRRRTLIGTIATILLSVGLAAPAAQDTARHPNLSGIWGPRFVQSINDDPPMRPETRARFLAQKGEDDPLNRCEPPGIPRLMNLAFPFEIIQTDAVVYFLFEYDQHTRRVFIDGTHPPNLDPLWLGHSVGRWEGDTLVVDTVGFNDSTWLDMRGHLHSDALHVIERFTRSADGQSLVHEVTIDDPKMYERPWPGLTKTHALRPDMRIQEFICEP